MINKQLLIIAAVFMMLSVILGAFGAHGLKNVVDAYQLDIWQKGVFYQFIHSLSIFIVWGLWHQNIISNLISGWLFIIGIICFSGSLYLLALKPIISFLPVFIGLLTPIGGLFFVAGWVALTLSLLKKPAIH